MPLRFHFLTLTLISTFLFSLSFLAACAPAAAPGGKAGPTSASDGQLTPTDTPEKRVSPTADIPFDGAVVVLRQTGGFAGRVQEWQIFADGRLLVNGKESIRLEPVQVENLLKEIQASGFYDLDKDSYISGACNDCYLFTLTVQDGRIVRQVAVEETSADQTGMKRIIQAVQKLVNGK